MKTKWSLKPIVNLYIDCTTQQKKNNRQNKPIVVHEKAKPYITKVSKAVRQKLERKVFRFHHNLHASRLWIITFFRSLGNKICNSIFGNEEGLKSCRDKYSHTEKNPNTKGTSFYPSRFSSFSQSSYLVYLVHLSLELYNPREANDDPDCAYALYCYDRTVAGDTAQCRKLISLEVARSCSARGREKSSKFSIFSEAVGECQG